MFEKLINKNPDFSKFIKIKGEYLHKQVYDLLLELNNQKEVNYEELSSIIRYDKCLRDKLYIYLATFEEYIRAYIFRNYDLAETPKEKNAPIDKLVKITVKKFETDNSKLYYYFNYDLGKTISYLEKNNDELVKSLDLESIRQLRNHVMHHNLITIGNSKTVKEMSNNLKKLKNQILALKVALPEDYRKGFINDINILKCDNKVFKVKI